ncbi:MAG TPA: hypothetical protein VN969_10355 [Streptosporangiaceae bacterium]|jgi:hypothetical protein|nr:hypothetical protein [Streptosporangiaceae bacterium]
MNLHEALPDTVVEDLRRDEILDILDLDVSAVGPDVVCSNCGCSCNCNCIGPGTDENCCG